MLCFQFVFCAQAGPHRLHTAKGRFGWNLKTSIDTAGTQSHFSARVPAGFSVIAGKHKISITKPRLSVQ